MTARPSGGHSSGSWLWSVEPSRVVHLLLDAARVASQTTLALHDAARSVDWPEKVRTYRERADELGVLERALRDLAHDVAAANPGQVPRPGIDA